MTARYPWVLLQDAIGRQRWTNNHERRWPDE